MPPKKPPRQVNHERHLAARIRELRIEKDWTLDRVAEKMTAAGCPIDRSAIYRIEKSNRQISFDEAVTFATVFAEALPSMMLPPEIARSREATKLFRAYQAARERFLAAAHEVDQLEIKLLRIASDGFEDQVVSAIEQGSDLDATKADPRNILDQWRYMTPWERLEEDLMDRFPRPAEDD